MVISWSDNAVPGTIGPDVLRFLFTDRGSGTTALISSPLDAAYFGGIETARMSGDARTGIGPMWTNKLLPHRTLDVIRRNDSAPQFRITYNRSTNINSGTNADFQVSTQGNLHLIPRIDGKVRAVTIGFFDDPSNQTDPLQETFLDVGGRTRIRDQTRIAFKLPNSADVILEITDAAGRPQMEN